MQDGPSRPAAPRLEELLLTRVCRRCGAGRLAEVSSCPSCRSLESDLVAPGSLAKLVSYTTIHRAAQDELEWPLPYSIGLIETDAGSRAIALLTWEPSDADVDGSVSLSTRLRADGLPLIVAERSD